MYKRQIYQIAESNRIEKIDSVARIESNRIETFLPELECSSLYCPLSAVHALHMLFLFQLSSYKFSFATKIYSGASYNISFHKT